MTGIALPGLVCNGTKRHQLFTMAVRNLLVGLAVVAVLMNQSLSCLELLDESAIQRLFEVDSIDKAPEHELVYPRVVTEEGVFAVTGDALSSDTLRLTFQAFGEDFDLWLERDDFGIAPDFEMRVISKEGTRQQPIRTDCLYSGKWNMDPTSLVTAETSDGLHVMIHGKGGPIYVTPLKDQPPSNRGLGLAHVAYKGSNEIHCATDNTMGPARFTSLNSASKPARHASQKVLELAMYSDYELYSKHGADTGMKILRLYAAVAGLLELPSLSSGNLMVKLTSGGVITDSNELQTSTDLNDSLDKCAVHAKANRKAPGVQFHFDNAAYISGFDLSGMYTGLGYVGVCGNDYSVSISEYFGPEGNAAVVAHEIGHNLGCPHDADPCSYTDYIMASVMDSSASEWSTCSKSYYNTFVGSAKDDNGVACYDDGGW